MSSRFPAEESLPGELSLVDDASLMSFDDVQSGPGADIFDTGALSPEAGPAPDTSSVGADASAFLSGGSGAGKFSRARLAPGIGGADGVSAGILARATRRPATARAPQHDLAVNAATESVAPKSVTYRGPVIRAGASLGRARNATPAAVSASAEPEPEPQPESGYFDDANAAAAVDPVAEAKCNYTAGVGSHDLVIDGDDVYAYGYDSYSAGNGGYPTQDSLPPQLAVDASDSPAAYQIDVNGGADGYCHDYAQNDYDDCNGDGGDDKSGYGNGDYSGYAHEQDQGSGDTDYKSQPLSLQSQSQQSQSPQRDAPLKSALATTAPSSRPAPRSGTAASASASASASGNGAGTGRASSRGPPSASRGATLSAAVAARPATVISPAARAHAAALASARAAASPPRVQSHAARTTDSNGSAAAARSAPVFVASAAAAATPVKGGARASAPAPSRTPAHTQVTGPTTGTAPRSAVKPPTPLVRPSARGFVSPSSSAQANSASLHESGAAVVTPVVLSPSTMLAVRRGGGGALQSVAAPAMLNLSSTAHNPPTASPVVSSPTATAAAVAAAAARAGALPTDTAADEPPVSEAAVADALRVIARARAAAVQQQQRARAALAPAAAAGQPGEPLPGNGHGNAAASLRYPFAGVEVEPGYPAAAYGAADGSGPFASDSDAAAAMAGAEAADEEDSQWDPLPLQRPELGLPLAGAAQPECTGALPAQALRALLANAARAAAEAYARPTTGSTPTHAQSQFQSQSQAAHAFCGHDGSSQAQGSASACSALPPVVPTPGEVAAGMVSAYAALEASHLQLDARDGASATDAAADPSSGSGTGYVRALWPTQSPLSPATASGGGITGAVTRAAPLSPRGSAPAAAAVAAALGLSPRAAGTYAARPIVSAAASALAQLDAALGVAAREPLVDVLDLWEERVVSVPFATPAPSSALAPANVRVAPAAAVAAAVAAASGSSSAAAAERPAFTTKFTQSPFRSAHSSTNMNTTGAVVPYSGSASAQSSSLTGSGSGNSMSGAAPGPRCRVYRKLRLGWVRMPAARAAAVSAVLARLQREDPSAPAFVSAAVCPGAGGALASAQWAALVPAALRAELEHLRNTPTARALADAQGALARAEAENAALRQQLAALQQRERAREAETADGLAGGALAAVVAPGWRRAADLLAAATAGGADAAVEGAVAGAGASALGSDYDRETEAFVRALATGHPASPRGGKSSSSATPSRRAGSARATGSALISPSAAAVKRNSAMSATSTAIAASRGSAMGVTVAPPSAVVLLSSTTGAQSVLSAGPTAGAAFGAPQGPAAGAADPATGLTPAATARLLALATLPLGADDERRALARALLASRAQGCALATSVAALTRRCALLQSAADAAALRATHARTLTDAKLHSFATAVDDVAGALDATLAQAAAVITNFSSLLTERGQSTQARAEALEDAFGVLQRETTAVAGALTETRGATDATLLALGAAAEARARWGARRAACEAVWAARQSKAKTERERERTARASLGGSGISTVTARLTMTSSVADVTALRRQAAAADATPAGSGVPVARMLQRGTPASGAVARASPAAARQTPGAATRRSLALASASHAAHGAAHSGDLSLELAAAQGSGTFGYDDNDDDADAAADGSEGMGSWPELEDAAERLHALNAAIASAATALAPAAESCGSEAHLVSAAAAAGEAAQAEFASAMAAALGDLAAVARRARGVKAALGAWAEGAHRTAVAQAQAQHAAEERRVKELESALAAATTRTLAPYPYPARALAGSGAGPNIASGGLWKLSPVAPAALGGGAAVAVAAEDTEPVTGSVFIPCPDLEGWRQAELAAQGALCDALKTRAGELAGEVSLLRARLTRAEGSAALLQAREAAAAGEARRAHGDLDSVSRAAEELGAKAAEWERVQAEYEADRAATAAALEDADDARAHAQARADAAEAEAARLGAMWEEHRALWEQRHAAAAREEAEALVARAHVEALRGAVVGEGSRLQSEGSEVLAALAEAMVVLRDSVAGVASVLEACARASDASTGETASAARQCRLRVKALRTVVNAAQAECGAICDVADGAAATVSSEEVAALVRAALAEAAESEDAAAAAAAGNVDASVMSAADVDRSQIHGDGDEADGAADGESEMESFFSGAATLPVGLDASLGADKSALPAVAVTAGSALPQSQLASPSRRLAVTAVGSPQRGRDKARSSPKKQPSAAQQQQRGQASGGATAKSGAAPGKGAAVVLANAVRALGRAQLALQHQEAAWARGEAALGGLRGAQAAQAGELLATRDALLGQLGRCEQRLQTAFTRLVRRGEEMAAGQLAADSTPLPQM